MQSLTIPHLLQKLETLYLFREREDILGFLEQNPFLVPLLIEGNEVVQRYFPDAKSALEIIHDPDSPDHAQLLLTIGTPAPVEEALARLDEFDAAWWHANRHRTQRKLVIDTELNTLVQ